MVVKNTISKELADKIKYQASFLDGREIMYAKFICFIEDLTEVKPPDLNETLRNMAERKQQQEDFYDGKFYEKKKIKPLVKPEKPLFGFESFDLFAAKINELIDRVNSL